MMFTVTLLSRFETNRRREKREFCLQKKRFSFLRSPVVSWDKKCSVTVKLAD